MLGKRFSGPVQFASYRVHALFRNLSDFFITELLVCDEQEQFAIFEWQGVQGLLYAPAEFLSFQDL